MMSDYFPPEILLQILLKLPTKSLIRFSSVSKSFLSLISSPFFISSYLSHSHPHPHPLLRLYDPSSHSEHYSLLSPSSSLSHTPLSFPFKSHLGYFRIVASLHGVLCLSDDLFAHPSPPLILWNPSIRKHSILPHPIINPLDKPHNVVLGFGFDDGVGEFKVVRMVYRRKDDDFGFLVPPDVEVFAGRSWRRLEGGGVGEIRLQIVGFMWTQVFANGSVHWLGFEEEEGGEGGWRSAILRFEVGREVFGEVSLPEELVRESVADMCLLTVGEKVAVLRYDRWEVGNEGCDVWVMREYGVRESWSRLHRVPLVDGMEKVVGFWRNGCEVLVATSGLELVAYNPESGKISNLGIRGTPRSFYVGSYVESLRLLKPSERVMELDGDGEEEKSSLDGFCIA